MEIAQVRITSERNYDRDARGGRELADRPERWLGGGPLEPTVRGYREASPAERAMLGILSSFAVTIATSRLINYVRERRRPAPALRDLARRAYHAPGKQKPRVHHFVPGIALSLAAGTGAIMKREDGLEFWLGIPFGTGAGLTLDEIAVLTELDNPYWESERLSLAQAGTAALVAIGLALQFHRRGSSPSASR